jgi:putative endonuclease
MPTSREIGMQAEQKACEYLEKQGLILLEQNYLKKTGEIDLIMQDKEYIVFVEVRLRNNQDFGAGFETVLTPKQNKLMRTAVLYLLETNNYDKAYCRFDIVSMTDQDKIEWIKAAFEASHVM